MSPVTPNQRKKVISKAATRLKFPQLFAVMAGLFVFDLFVPDLVPFIDEILLGLGAALFGLWREKVEGRSADATDGPPIKDVTPDGEGRPAD